MINSNELRMGNYVNHSYEGYLKVCALKHKSVTVFNNEQKFRHFHYTDIQAIDLTAEILLRLGFNLSYDEIFDLVFYDLGNISICEDFTLYGQKMQPMRYIHQLQNLVFLLRGEELEVTL